MELALTFTSPWTRWNLTLTARPSTGVTALDWLGTAVVTATEAAGFGLAGKVLVNTALGALRHAVTGASEADD